MEPLQLIETEANSYSLLLHAGDLQADQAVVTAGHEPNGYFWEGVARFLAATTDPSIGDSVDFDSEGGMFCAFGSDRAALDRLGLLMQPLANDGEGALIGALIESARASGHEFGD